MQYQWCASWTVRVAGSRSAPGSERGGEAPMERHPLAGEQVVEDRFPQQGVAEPVAAVVGDEELAVDSFADGRVEVGPPRSLTADDQPCSA